jgi:acetolactate synthase regulatory subunit
VAELYLTLELAPDHDAALLRVLSTLHRRRCRVLDASFRGDTDGGSDRLELRVQAPGPYAARVEHWLRGLVDVYHAAVRSTSVI